MKRNISKNCIYYRIRICFSEHDFYNLTLHRLQGAHVPCHFYYYFFFSHFLLSPQLSYLRLLIRSSDACWVSVIGDLLVWDGAQLPLYSLERKAQFAFFWVTSGGFAQQWIHPGVSSSEHMEEKGVCGLVAPSPGIYWNNKSNLCVYIINADMLTHTVYLEVLPHTVILSSSKVFVNISSVF